MPFTFPALPELLYRLFRLRRMIALAVLVPFLAFTIVGLISGGASLGGTVFLLVFLLLFLGGHLAVFPNAYEETLAISLYLTAFALLSPIIGGYVLGWVFLFALAVWFLFSVPGRILNWQTGTEPRPMVLSSRIRVAADAGKVREWFPLRPGKSRGHFRCGEAGQDGIFPVWYEAPSVDIFAGLNVPETPEYESIEDFHDAIGLDKDDPAHAVNKMLHEEQVASAPDADAPTLWAVIEKTKPDYQKTRLMTKEADGSWKTESVVEHAFKALKRGGVVVTETDTNDAFPRGMAFTMWLNDFQADGLVYLRDLLLKTETHALRGTHRWSLMTLLGRWFAARQIAKYSEA
jgi:hypothetical protein